MSFTPPVAKHMHDALHTVENGLRLLSCPELFAPHIAALSAWAARWHRARRHTTAFVRRQRVVSRMVEAKVKNGGRPTRLVKISSIILEGRNDVVDLQQNMTHS
jgi:hypothetical protein